MRTIALDLRLPGAELVEPGLRDLAAGRFSEEALLVAAAAPRLRALGLEVPQVTIEAPLHRLYADLVATGRADAHAHLNALIGRIVSFSRAAEHAAAR